MARKRGELDQAHQFLGYISPAPSTNDQLDGSEEETEQNPHGDDAERPAGSRDVDEGGGVATEVGGTRNYHHSGGATGGDLGNRPE
jgi:hypothetical protein